MPFPLVCRRLPENAPHPFPRLFLQVVQQLLFPLHSGFFYFYVAELIKYWRGSCKIARVNVRMKVCVTVSARVNVRMEARVKICAWSCSVLRDVVLGKNN